MNDLKRAFCFFEQSGTFKNEFKKLGVESWDFDIANDYGETDRIMDLFAEIDKAFDGLPSVFDEIEGGGISSLLSFPASDSTNSI